MVKIISTTFDEDGTETRTVRDYPGQSLVIGDHPGEPLRLVPEDGGDFPCCAPKLPRLNVGIPATDRLRDDTLERVRAVLRSVPTEYLMNAAQAALGEFRTRTLPDLELTKDSEGNNGVACPWAGCDGTEVEEVDASQRTNPTELQDGILFTYQGDGSYETVYWSCATCGRPVRIPDELEVEWS